MGWEHVIPQFAIRMKELCEFKDAVLRFPIQGDGNETRAFIFIDDFILGLGLLLEYGEHLGIYNIGTNEEVTIRTLAEIVGKCFGRKIEIQASDRQIGGTKRRCPDMTKLTNLGYKPIYSLRTGVPSVVQWYVDNYALRPKKEIIG
jgi:nucleoside-diphosphate-sugar epimerase